MVKRTLTLFFLVVWVVVGATGTGLADPPKLKMTTDIPESLLMPDEVETRLGTLRFIDGFPDQETARKVYDQMDFQRAVEAMMMTLPPNVPVADFWAITLYDTQTRSQLQTDQKFPTLDTYTKGLKKEKDGSYVVYFGPDAPKGHESNWLQNRAGQGVFRLPAHVRADRALD